MSICLKVFVSLFGLSFLHRVLAHDALHAVMATQDVSLWREMVVGGLSDFWTCVLISLPLWFAQIFWPQKTRQQHVAAVLWVGLWGLLTAGHQGYVEFFHYQIIPYHLSYLYDSSFLRSNGSSMTTGGPLAMIVATGFATVWCAWRPVFWSRRKTIAGFIVLAAIAAGLHAVNIRWRVNWFVAEALQTHYLERLFMNMQTKQVPRPLTDKDYAKLEKISGKSLENGIASLLKPKQPSASPATTAIKQALAEIRKQGRSPIIITLAAESFRPVDSGWTRDPSDPPSVTPFFDTLMQTGVFFNHAYSSGPVTRGGQEALWCGVPTATQTSLMRSFPTVKQPCIGDLARSIPSRVLWMHGGDSRFDSQVNFWIHHGIDKFLLATDFPANTPSTGWGIGDLSFLDKAAQEIILEARAGQSKTLEAFVLSVSNHIPWDLPTDAPPEVLAVEAKHPSFKTTRYFDFALQHFVEALKREGLWQDTVLVISSDHGNTETPRNTSWLRNDAHRYEHFSSHINLLLSGGVMESVRSKGTIVNVIDRHVAQPMVATFVAEITGLPANDFMDVSLVDEQQIWPVVADLNQYLFLPKDNVVITKEDVMAKPTEEFDGPAQAAVLRYRALLTYLYGQGTGH